MTKSLSFFSLGKLFILYKTRNLSLLQGNTDSEIRINSQFLDIPDTVLISWIIGISNENLFFRSDSPLISILPDFCSQVKFFKPESIYSSQIRIRVSNSSSVKSFLIGFDFEICF